MFTTKNHGEYETIVEGMKHLGSCREKPWMLQVNAWVNSQETGKGFYTLRMPSEKMFVVFGDNAMVLESMHSMEEIVAGLKSFQKRGVLTVKGLQVEFDGIIVRLGRVLSRNASIASGLLLEVIYIPLVSDMADSDVIQTFKDELFNAIAPNTKWDCIEFSSEENSRKYWKALSPFIVN